MSLIAFIGCDGCGKSAVIRCVAERLRAENIAVTCGHWRPKAFARAASVGATVTVEDPHGRPPRGFATSCLKLGWLWLHWWVGWWTGLRQASKEGLVLFDRFHGDLLVDPRRYRYGAPLWLAAFATRFMPQPDLILFLDAPADVLLARKQEVSREALEISRQRYLELQHGNPRFVIIDASQPLPQVVEAAWLRIDTLRTQQSRA